MLCELWPSSTNEMELILLLICTCKCMKDKNNEKYGIGVGKIKLEKAISLKLNRDFKKHNIYYTCLCVISNKNTC